MDETLVSPERNPVDLVLFGIGFASLLVGIAGVGIDVACLAIAGAVLFLFVVMTFWIRSA